MHSSARSVARSGASRCGRGIAFSRESTALCAPTSSSTALSEREAIARTARASSGGGPCRGLRRLKSAVSAAFPFSPALSRLRVQQRQPHRLLALGEVAMLRLVGDVSPHGAMAASSAASSALPSSPLTITNGQSAMARPFRSLHCRARRWGPAREMTSALNRTDSAAIPAGARRERDPPPNDTRRERA
jgi:hypothetical protein